MIIVLKPDAPPEAARELLARIEEKGLTPLHMPGSERVVLGALGDERVLAELRLESNPYVESVKPILAPYKLVSRELRPEDSVVRIGRVGIGGEAFAVLAGPDAIEDEASLQETAQAVKSAGASVLRGGAFRSRISPYAFEGLGAEGLDILARTGRAAGMPVVTEALSEVQLEEVVAKADAVVIGARNMNNFPLLKAAAESGAAILLKRGLSATVEELLLAAEYLLHEGNDRVVLVERGVRTFETNAPAMLDLTAVPFIKRRSHLPVLVDPSNGTGRRELVAPMALAAAACGADGVLIDVHPAPPSARAGGAQALDHEAFRRLMRSLVPVVQAVGRSLA
jgi:3-deoxy-7-phosphoheptulonate synthase